MRDKKIWIFNAGMAFSGNPKWLFMYIVNYRKDITPYWFCYNQECVKKIRSLGYHAYLFKSSKAEKIGSVAGVYVVDQQKEVFQEYLQGITVLNLWHGVGCKSIEKKVDAGSLNEKLMKKAVRNNEYYLRRQLFLVTSPLMEKHFSEQCDVDENRIVRAGYPSCVYPDKISTFDHNIQKIKGLSEDTKIVVYVPTYRDYLTSGFFSKAIPDIEKLLQTIAEKNLLLILKIHPHMEKDFQFQYMRQKYHDHPNLLFWDNANDFYEVIDQIDLAIVDYSSIFYDLLAKGVKKFIRYIFDYDNPDNRKLVFDYKEMTCGKICNTFEELLESLKNTEETDPSELERIYQLFWSYSNENSFETIIERALDFETDESDQLPTLYSFDIFDTLIGRTTLRPKGVFRYVQEKMKGSGENYPSYVKQFFGDIRVWAEQNCREYYRKSQLLRQTDHIEITFDMIYDRIQELYGLSDEQKKQLQEWELECEYQTSVPCRDKIEMAKSLHEKGETVVLISDMYLPERMVKKLLAKADPFLAELPLFLSSEYGVQKSTKKLYVELYHKLDYRFGKWIHYGDNPKADGKMPKRLGIETVNHDLPELDPYEEELNHFLNTYDAYQISALFSRFRMEEHTSQEIFVYCYVSLYLAPYVDWAIDHAIKNGIQTLYFISRDGHYLKLIADAIISTKKLNIKTKYIYGSRRAWRIPSQIGKIDEEFFSDFGNFSDIINFDMLLTAADISEQEFLKMFPELHFLKENSKNFSKNKKLVRTTLANSQQYRKYLLEKAAEEREPVLRYLRREIDFNEKYAFVEYWGRGYTQTCLARLIWEASGTQDDNLFYYARSIYPSQGHFIRYNFSPNTSSLIFVEAFFANMPYKSIERYEIKDDQIYPVIEPTENISALHETCEFYLPKFARDYSEIRFQDEDQIRRGLFDFGLSYFYQFQGEEIFVKNMSSLRDTVATYGETREYAPKISIKAISLHLTGHRFRTRSKEMSLNNSHWIYRKTYEFYCKFKDTKVWRKLLKFIRRF